jgi:site-specific DNA recombinase
MRSAYLYIRVSTDEQADKGYSQRNQEELLRKYCQVQGIAVERVIYEDHSAKTFNRPAWQSMLTALKKKKTGRPGFLLFTKWDRFSRNAGDAYQMISILRELGMEPQAIDQPLDLAIPENKMMLAFYLAAPEVENDRRALNIFHGMRRARKEGRWISSAPTGYANKSYEDGRKYIAINEPQAAVMRWAFNEIATGKYSVEQIWKAAKKKGLSCGRNNFWNLIRNPVYCGQIIIPAYKDEPLRLVRSQHEAIISEAVFDRAQRVLNRSRRQQRTKMTVPSRLPLRGFLKCPECTRMLSGSPSKGCRTWYYYYHCSSSCGVRFNAGVVNEAMIAELKCYLPRPPYQTLIKKIITDALRAQFSAQQNQQQLAQKQLEDQQNRFNRAKDLLLAGDLDAADYREIKKDTNDKIATLQERFATFINPSETVYKVLKKFDKVLLDLAFIYQKADTAGKRKLVTLLFPENLVYNADGFAIKRIGAVLRLVYERK